MDGHHSGRLLTARNRKIQQHRECMIRSYAVTVTFLGTRVLQPTPAWNRFSAAAFAMAIIVITLISDPDSGCPPPLA